MNDKESFLPSNVAKWPNFLQQIPQQNISNFGSLFFENWGKTDQRYQFVIQVNNMINIYDLFAIEIDEGWDGIFVFRFPDHFFKFDFPGI